MSKFRLLIILVVVVMLCSGCIDKKMIIDSSVDLNMIGQKTMYDLCTNWNVSGLEYNKGSDISYMVNDVVFVRLEIAEEKMGVVQTIKIDNAHVEDSRDVVEYLLFLGETSEDSIAVMNLYDLKKDGTYETDGISYMIYSDDGFMTIKYSVVK